VQELTTRAEPAAKVDEANARTANTFVNMLEQLGVAVKLMG
jgi:hypothetical protein